MLDLVRDPSGLGGAEPRPLVLADQALERCPTLERNKRKREDQRTDDALHVARRRLFEDEPGEVHQRQGEDVREEQRPSEQRGPPRHVSVEHDLGDEPGDRTNDKQRRLQVVARVVQELELLDRGDEGRPHDRQEPLAHVVGVAFRPAHALPGQTPEGAHAFGRRLGPRRVDHLVAPRVELERQLPVLRDAGPPTDLTQDVGADHVSRAGDHLQRADRILERPLDHVAARILGAHRLRQPALRFVEHVPLVALDRRHFCAALDLAWLRRGISTSKRSLETPAGRAVADAIEKRQQALDRVRERDRVGIEDDHVLGARVHDLQRFAKRSALVTGTARAVKDLEARPVPPAL